MHLQKQESFDQHEDKEIQTSSDTSTSDGDLKPLSSPCHIVSILDG